MNDAPAAGAGVPVRTPTPRAIVEHLDHYVIGQDEAKKIVAVAVYAHFKKIESAARARSVVAKSNILLVGPSGTGKTLLCETLARGLEVPFVTAEATSLAQTRFVNDEIEAILHRLVDRSDGDIGRAQCGIVFIDEIDKLKAPAEGRAQGGSGESVQHALLRIMEGSSVKLRDGRYVDTSNVLFICGGAFVGIEQIIAQTHTYGYISTSAKTDVEKQRILERLNTRIKPTDLFTYGLIPEFTGRLPIVARFRDLDRAMLVRIMTEPRDAVFRQFREIFGNEGVDLAIEPPVFRQIAELAIEYRTGARSLRGIFEELLAPVLYEVPDDRGIERVTFTSLFEPPVVTRRA